MKRILQLLLAFLSISLFLTGCSDPTAANKENFTDALNTALVSKQALIPSPGIPSTVESGLMVIQDLDALNGDHAPSVNDRKTFRRQLTFAKLLQSAGVVTIEHGKYKHRNFRGEIVELYGYKIRFNKKYEKDIRVSSDGRISLIAGYIGVTKIISFTEPKAQGGKVVSKVTYTRTVISRPEWATDAIIKYSGIEVKMKGAVTANLVQNKDGWEVMGIRRSAQETAASSIRNAIRSGNLQQASER